MNEIRAEVTVPVDPERAFLLFTRDIDHWWRRGERYGGPEVIGHRLEPWIGGRFLEISSAGESVLGLVTRWHPPDLLAFTWQQSNWLKNEITEVTVSFRESDSCTQVRLHHRGFESVRSQIGCDVGYQAGWNELLSWYQSTATAPIQERPCM
jgi:uncharacterized protein YndB with AHSA1/START domain